MKTAFLGFAFSVVALSAVPVAAQNQSSYPMADKLAAKVIDKYQNSSCQQLAAEKQNPPTGQKAAMEQRVMRELQNNAQMRTYFINKVAAPIANKLFDCGMIP